MKDRMTDVMKLENQMCFPLYAASREVIKRYRPFLDEVGLTYTQYIAMLVIWETGTISVRDLGRRLYLDSGTLTPLLKTLEKNGLITRRRSDKDERMLLVNTTKAGHELQAKASSIPEEIRSAIPLADQDAAALAVLLNKLLENAGDM